MRFVGLFSFLLICSSCSIFQSSKMSVPTKEINWQGHRGCRGLLPENSIQAFIKALEYPIQTLELDVVVSKDKHIIVSHEPWFSHHIATNPDGTPVTKDKAEGLNIYKMELPEIRMYDCGLRGNEKFPEQQAQRAHKPTFTEMVKEVESVLMTNQKNATIEYNIELKSKPDWYNKYIPAPKEFVALLIAELEELGIKNRVTLQSFDINILEEIHRQDKEITIAYLIENMKGFEANLERLSFQPPIYSPYFRFVNEKLMEKAHAKGMKVIPWTVNEVKDMKKLISIGIDGIITDYPNRIKEAIK